MRSAVDHALSFCDYNCGSLELCQITGPVDYCMYPGDGCPPGEQQYGGCCGQFSSPIIIDVAGDDFALTDREAGVIFPLGPSQFVYRVAWTEPDTDDAWLVLDRNGNGRIDNGQELFGSATPQPPLSPGEIPHGFRALAEFDKRANGGNRDERIDRDDRIFGSLRLWQDVNHNGESEPFELHTLTSLSVRGLDLRFQRSRRVDEFGNLFRYRARVYSTRSGDPGRWAYDVFLQIARLTT